MHGAGTGDSYIASAYQRDALAYLMGKTRAFRTRVDWLEVVDGRGQLIAEVLSALWDDPSFAELERERGLRYRPAALRESFSFALRLRRLAADASSPPGPAAAAGRTAAAYVGPAHRLLADHAAPARAHAALGSLSPQRQQQVAELMVRCEDYSTRFIVALRAGTPEPERALINRLGRRRKALQGQLAAEEHALRDLCRREAELRESCALRAFQLSLADAYVRRLLADPTARAWLTRRNCREVEALEDYRATTSALLSPLTSRARSRRRR